MRSEWLLLIKVYERVQIGKLYIKHKEDYIRWQRIWNMNKIWNNSIGGIKIEEENMRRIIQQSDIKLFRPGSQPTFYAASTVKDISSIIF